MNNLLHIAVIAFPAFLTAADAFLAVPGSVGNAESVGPFFVPTRWQQVYDSSAFSNAGFNGVSITALYFKGDGVSITNIQLSLSTTSKAVDSLGPVFADNVGTDNTVIYSGFLMLNSGLGPSTFNLLVTLQTPFHYQPANGNLLLDVRNFSGGILPVPPSIPTIDVSTVAGDSVSRLYATDVGAAFGTADTSGLLTLFVVDPIPEPSSLALLFLGTATFWLSARRRKLQLGNSSEAQDILKDRTTEPDGVNSFTNEGAQPNQQ